MKVLKNCMFCLMTVFHYAPINVIICFIGFFVPGFFTGLNVLLVQNIVDSAVAYANGTGELNTLILYGVLLVVMTTLWASLQRIAIYQRDLISVKLTKKMAPDIADRLMKLEFSAFEEQATHEIFQKMTKEPEQRILDCFYRVMIVGTTTISLIFTMAVFFSISPWIGIGVIVIGIPMAILGYYSAGRQVVITEEAADARRRIADLKGLLTNKHAMFEMKLFGAEELFMRKWNYYGDKQEKLTMRENKKILLMNVSSNMLSLIYIIFVVCMVAVGLLNGGLTLGQFTAALSGAVGVQDKLTGAVWHVSILIRLSMDMSFYMKFMEMDVRTDIGDKSELKYYDIAFENVSFKYPGTEREILRNVTFYVKEGERIAFVGENGAGKTTIIKLLCGLYEPTTGNITIGGVSVREISEELRLKLLSVVFQNFGSFQMTLRENVAFGNLSAINDDEKLKKALALAGAVELSELEDPSVLDRFKKAEATSYTGPYTVLRAHFYFIDRLSMIVTGLAGCIGAMAVVGSYSPVLVISGLIGIIPALGSKIYFEKVLTKIRRAQSNIKRRCDYLWSLFTSKESMKEMRVMGFGGYLKDKWEAVNTERVEELRVVRLDVGKKQVVGISVINVFYALNIAVAVYLMVNGQISIGAFAACLSAFATYHTHMQNVIAIVAETISVYDSVADYYEYFTIPVETDGDTEYKPFADKIAANNVYFRYNGSTRDALSGLSCEIKKGEHVVIVGENGSGKTTFSKLLTGAYLPSEGSITYDNQKTEELSRKSLYDHISVVSQDFVHYHFTLGENIGISDLKRDDTKAMGELLEAVAGDEFLDKVGGLDVQLGREFGGMELSGGEWQKVAIARGLWKESDIIILDEPTSALDPLVEYDILSKFVEMIQDKTSVIISHRVGICRSADKIIVMKNGRMVECGKHEELVSRGGEYSHIWNEQAKWYA